MEQILSGSTLLSGTRKTGNVPGDFQVRDVMKEVFSIEPWLYPLSQMVFLEKSAGHQCKNVYGKVEWIEDEMIWNQDTFSAVSGGGTNTLTITPTQIKLYTVGRMIRFEDTDQVGRVATVGSTTFTVSRPNSSDTWTSPTAGTNIHLLGSANGENSLPPEAVSDFGVFRYNYPQIHEKTIKMTDRMIAATKAGGTYDGNEWVTQLRKRGKEMRRDIEMNSWFATDAYAAVDSTTGEVITYNKGVFAWVLDNGGTDATYSTTGITEDELDNIVYQRKFGTPEAVVFAGNDLTAGIEKIIKARYSNVTAVERYGAITGAGVGGGVRFVEYTVGGQVLQIVRNPLWTGKYAKWGCILDMGCVQPIYFPPDDKGQRKMRMEDNIQDPNAPRKEAKILADIGIIVTTAAVNTVIRPL